jgi:hypothetical protein
MRRIASLFLIVLLASSAALAHGGSSGKVLGTVKEVHEGHMVVTTKDGHEVTVHLTEKTKYEKASKAATRGDLAPGARVSIVLGKDRKSAATVKIGSPKSK